jgi:hypothetical protein
MFTNKGLLTIIVFCLLHGIPWMLMNIQILLLRQAKAMLQVLKMYPRYVLVPHRLMPYPETVSIKFSPATIITGEERKIA